MGVLMTQDRYQVRHSMNFGWYVFDTVRGAACERFPQLPRSTRAQYLAAEQWIREQAAERV